MNNQQETPSIFDFKGRADYQATTWKRSDIPVEVLPRMGVCIGYKNLEDAQQDFPHIILGQGMRGEWRDVCEYVLRIELW